MKKERFAALKRERGLTDLYSPIRAVPEDAASQGNELFVPRRYDGSFDKAGNAQKHFPAPKPELEGMDAMRSFQHKGQSGQYP